MLYTVDKVHYFEQLNTAAQDVPHVAFVGDRGLRVRVPLLTAVAVSSVLAASIDINCSCRDDEIVVVLPGISTKNIEMFVDFILGETVYGNRGDMLLLGELCFLFGIKVQLGIGTREEGQSVDSIARPQTLETLECIVKKENVTRDIEEVYAEEETTATVPLVITHNTHGILRDRLLGIGTTEEDLSVYSMARHQPLGMSECIVMEEDVTRDIEEVYIRDETTATVPLVITHKTNGNGGHLLGICTTEEDSSVNSTARHQMLGTSECIVMEKDITRDIEEVYVKEEITAIVPSVKTHESERILEDHVMCEICQQQFPQQQLEQHACISPNSTADTMENDNQEEEETCFSNYSQHKYVETGKEIFKCRYCGKSFGLKYNCKRHEQGHSKEQTYHCNYCSKGFTTFSNCKLHERTHTDDKPFQCKYCSKSFYHKQNLNSHERTHTGEKPYKCKYCNRAFAQKSACNTHEFTHTGYKPFKCKYCDKSFRSHSNVSVHELTHTGEKPFKCAYCNKYFPTKDFRRRHEYIHTGTKPYKCKHCEARFTESGNCKQHEKRHLHDVKRYGSKYSGKRMKPTKVQSERVENILP